MTSHFVTLLRKVCVACDDNSSKFSSSAYQISNLKPQISIILYSVSARFSMENPIPTFTTGRGSVA